jgi:hypothetical protein
VKCAEDEEEVDGERTLYLPVSSGSKIFARETSTKELAFPVRSYKVEYWGGETSSNERVNNW